MLYARSFLLLALVTCSSNSATPDAKHIDAAIAAESNCFDGIDNNGDGKIDCDDPTCAATAVCADAIPQGWTGFAAIYDDVVAGAPSGCAAPFPTGATAGSAGFAEAPATCTACACGAPAGGICPSSGGVATVPPVTWSRVGVACESAVSPSATDCTAGTCQPRPVAPFTNGLCIHQTGDVACPAGAFSVRHVFYTTDTDDRGCTACVCGAPVAGMCAFAGGAASGSAAPAGATTYCCSP